MDKLIGHINFHHRKENKMRSLKLCFNEAYQLKKDSYIDIQVNQFLIKNLDNVNV